MNNTDFEIRKAIAGDGNTIFECDSNLGSGVTDYEVLKTLANGATKYECTLNYARSLGLLGNYQTRYEADLAIYEASKEPIPYFELNEDISTDEEFNNLPWGRTIEVIELKRTLENNTWYTLAFPFDCKRTDIALTQQELSICEVLRVKGNIDDGGYYDSVLVADDGVIKANHPYQVYNHSGQAITSLIGNNVHFTTNKLKTNTIHINDNYYFIANFFCRTFGVDEPYTYAYNNGQALVWIPDTGKEIKAYSGVFYVSHDTKTITDGWDNEITKYTDVIVDGNITLEGGVYDMNSLTFTEGSHITLKNCTFRVWQGGLTNSDITTNKYITVYEDYVAEEFTNFLIHPTSTDTPKLDIKCVLNSSYDGTTLKWFRLSNYAGITNMTADYNVAVDVLNRSTNSWEQIGTTQRQNIDYTKLNQYKGDSTPMIAQNPVVGTILTIEANYSQDGAVEFTANNWNNASNVFLSGIKLADYYNKIKSEGGSVNWRQSEQDEWNTLADSDFAAGGKFENTIMNPLDGNLIINASATKIIYFDYKTLVWDKSL